MVFDNYPVEHIEINSKKAKASSMTDSLGQFSIVCMENDVIKVNPRAFKAMKKKVYADTDSEGNNCPVLLWWDTMSMSVEAPIHFPFLPQHYT